MKRHVLLTGVTGFVGKVVLYDLLKRSEELGIARVSVLVRPKASRHGSTQAPAERFANGVARAEIFRQLAPGWERRVTVVGAELEQPDLGLSASDREELEGSVTHVIHCAASVEFDLPIKSALLANVEAALHMLELARRCKKLSAMVSVSTAYVSVWRDGPITEKLAHLTRSAEDVRRGILDGTFEEATLLAESGHPNTYTYTKCLAEHLLSQRRGDVPLAIVRPSIISAAWAEPKPGWIDSNAAFAGCLLYTGLGLVKVWEANPNVRLDVVPVDVVTERIRHAAFVGKMPVPGEAVPIHLAAMGLAGAMRADMSTRETARFFEERPGAKAPPGVFIGGLHHGVSRQELLKRALPVEFLRAYFTVTRQAGRKRQIEVLDERVRRLNSAFRYFIHHSFDFRPAVSCIPANFSAAAYIDVVNRGMYKHLLRKNETELTLAGKAHEDLRGDLSWAHKRNDGSPVIRTLGVALRKALRRCTTSVTYDRTSFERAVAAIPPGHLFVLAPSHRSYFDFLLSSYLCFQHPELGLPVPQIAAAEEFSRIPLITPILSRAGAFYVRRGVGKALPEVREEIRRIASRHRALMFFIEGQRSRGRHVLPPKRGLLRALQTTGQAAAIIPIAISYERIPEEGAFERELRGGRRSAMSLEAIVRWLLALSRGQVDLGRIHIACGEPQTLLDSTDVQELARRVAGELQQKTVITSFHLRMFLAHGFSKAEAGPQPLGIDEAWLRAAIEARGGRVLESDTPVPAEASQSLIQSLQNQWIHWFYADALALFPDDPTVRDHVARHSWTALPPASASDDPRLRALVMVLLRPVIQAYELVIQHAKQLPLEGGAPVASTDPVSMVLAHPATYLLHLEDAFRSLTERGMLHEVQPGRYAPASAP
jgi:alcohol-forming fatty acyl-CoA reductase